MARRGSKYARKHFVEAKEEKDIEREIAQKPYLEVIYDDVNFVEVFHRLPLEDALKAYEMLIALSKEKNPNKDSRADAANKLNLINKSMGLCTVEREGAHLPKDETLIIRMDLYGRIDVIDPRFKKDKLSTYYLTLINKPLQKRPKAVEYDFASSPSWKLYTRFQSFRQIERKLRAYFVKYKIDPQILKLMTPRDFSDLIVQTFQTDDNKRKVSFVDKDSVKDEFVKEVATKYGQEMASIWRKKGYDERYIRSQLNAMRRFGSTNTNKLIVTEIYFTDRVLADLKAEGLLYDGFEKGNKIPQHFVDYLIDTKRGDLIVARDEKGRKIYGSQFTSYEVHHLHAVSEGGDLTNVAHINYRNNLCLLPSDIHAIIMHGNDEINGTYSRRTEFIGHGVFFMGGLNKEEQLRREININRSKRMKKDDKYNVTYEDCMRELAANQKAYDEKHRTIRFNIQEEIIEVNRFYQNKKFGYKKSFEQKKRKIQKIVAADNNKEMRAKIDMLMKGKFNGRTG